MGPRPRVTIALVTAADAASHWRDFLQNGGAFCAGDAPTDEDVTLVLVRAGCADLELAARAVYRAPHGTGYELEDWNAELRQRVLTWTETATEAETATETETGTGTETETGSGTETETETGTETETETETGSDTDTETGTVTDGRRPEPAKNLQQRLRNLPVHQQSKLARDGDFRERVALERLYGKPLWESLLRNPRITPPEVARIARMGTLPFPLLELIVGNGGWVRAPEVRRALLANLKLTADMIPRILRMLPRHELKLVPSQTAYPMAVREVARRMLREP